MTAAFLPQHATASADAWNVANFADDAGGEQGLPDHQAEMLAGYRPTPTIAEQDASHGAGLPAEDHGISDQAKYGSAPSAC